MHFLEQIITLNPLIETTDTALQKMDNKRKTEIEQYLRTILQLSIFPTEHKSMKLW